MAARAIRVPPGLQSMLPLSKIVISVASSVALAVGVVTWQAQRWAGQLASESASILLDVLTREQRGRWQQETVRLAAELGAAEPDQAGAPTGAASLLRRALEGTSELESARILAGDGAELAHAGAPAASGAGNSAVTGAALVSAWRERPAPEQSIAQVPAPGEQRMYLVYPIAPARRGDAAIRYLVTAYSTTPLATIAADLERHYRAESRTSLLLLVIIGVGSELLALILLFLYVRRAGHGAAAPADQPAPAPQEPRTGPTLHHMAGELAALLEETAAKSRMDKDLELVQTVQTTLLPSDELVQRGRLSFAGKQHSAGTCGGDWWTYHDLADGKVLLALGDVTGHGASAAMITAAAKAACDLACDLHDNRPSVSAVLSLMNQAVFHAGGRRLLMTCFAMTIDPRSGEIEFANAGHNFPWLARVGTGELRLSSLIAHGNRLGDERDSSYQVVRSTLVGGDRVLLYTDGVIECENTHGAQYGSRRMRDVIASAGDDPIVLRDEMLRSVRAFSDGTLHDDLTLVAVRFA